MYAEKRHAMIWITSDLRVRQMNHICSSRSQGAHTDIKDKMAVLQDLQPTEIRKSSTDGMDTQTSAAKYCQKTYLRWNQITPTVLL